MERMIERSEAHNDRHGDGVRVRGMLEPARRTEAGSPAGERMLAGFRDEVGEDHSAASWAASTQLDMETSPPVAAWMRCAISSDGFIVPAQNRETVEAVVLMRAAKAVCFSPVRSR